MLAGEVVHVDAVDERSEQVCDHLVRTVRSFEGCRQTKTGGRSEQARDIAETLSTEVVDLVEDDQPEAVAEFGRAEIRRIVGRDGHIFHVLLAPAELSDGTVELRRQFPAPLCEEVDSRNDDECRHAKRFHRGDADDSFPAAGRQFEHAALWRAGAGVALAGLPRIQRVLLVLAEPIRRTKIEGRKREHVVRDLVSCRVECVAKSRVLERRCSQRLRTGVVLDVEGGIGKRLGIESGVAGDANRSVLESERHVGHIRSRGADKITAAPFSPNRHPNRDAPRTMKR